ncbi:MAG: aminotransferase class IV, partial [Mycobacteriales bacterium]
MITWCNGLFFDAETPVLHSDDHGFVVGDGVFETVAVREGRPFALRRHLERLARSAAGLEIPADLDQVRDAVVQVLAADRAPAGRSRLRITLTGGRAPLSSERGQGPPTLVVVWQAAEPSAPTSTVAVVPWPR